MSAEIKPMTLSPYINQFCWEKFGHEQLNYKE